jgi:polysaccharide export outer membrane protein
VTIPLVDPVKCEGMTLQELTDKLRIVLAKYIRDPQVSVQFHYVDGMLSPWGTVNVLGKVGREGPVNIPPTCDLRVSRALQLAGGITPLGDKTKVRITRKLRNQQKVETVVNVEEIGKSGRTDYDHILQNGDVIWVPEILF